jgi:hypothetical protein
MNVLEWLGGITVKGDETRRYNHHTITGSREQTWLRDSGPAQENEVDTPLETPTDTTNTEKYRLRELHTRGRLELSDGEDGQAAEKQRQTS